MPDTPSETPKRRRAVLLSVVAVVVVTIVVAAVIAVTLNARTGKVISAVQASFPDFCQGGQISAEMTSVPGRYWGVRCNTWIQGGDAFYGYATIIDVNQCTTVKPLVGTEGSHSYEMDALNKSNGQQMSMCP